jgi:Cdc6-like AAA superfamily ATPase
LDILEKQGTLTSSNIYESYLGKAEERDLRTKSIRTINKYLNELDEIGFIEWERKNVRGNVRILKGND